MKSRQQAVLVVLCLAAGRGVHAQATQENGLSLQGFTGVLNTPNAQVQQQGTLDMLYTNQTEPINGNISPWQDNYFFSFGMFRFAEIGGRLTNNISAMSRITGARTRDLSLNFKLTSAPLTSRYRFSPTLAVGAEDPGDGHHFFQTTYGVGSVNPVSWVRISAGYGRGPDRMKGAFAGGELRAFDWATVLADYDTRHANVGVRLTAPELPWIRARLTATVSTPVQSSNPQKLILAGGFILPLNFKERARRESQKTLCSALTSRKAKVPLPPPPSPVEPSYPAYAAVPATLAGVPVQKSATLSNPVEPLSQQELRERLIKDGFVNVRVGQQDKTLVVEYENIRYNHSELDAIGVVCGLASRTAGGGAEELRLVIRRKGLALLQIGTDLSQLHHWLEGNTTTPAPALSITQTIAGEQDTHFVAGSTNPGRLKPSIMVYPSLITLIGTEHGLFDYQLSIRPELQVPLWRGATAVARADLPVSWSPNLDNGQIYSAFRTPARLDRTMLFQALPLAPGLVANLGAGKVLGTANGTLNELDWIVKGGMNRFNVTQAWVRDGNTTRNVALGSYRLLLARYDVALEASGGRFWAQDTGLMMNMQRFFGDTSVSLYYKDTVAPGDSQRYRQAGVRIDFPLTPRRDMKAKPIQIRGHEDWSFSQETGLVSSSTQNTNYIKPDAAIVPDTTQSLAVYYYDRERLNSDYILSHTERIREAWLVYRDKL